MSLYYKQKLISGVRDVPSMTLAEYNALTNKPKLWIRTDAPSGDRGINADDIQYDSNTSVKEKIALAIGEELTYCYGESFGLEANAYSRAVSKSITIPSNNGDIEIFPSIAGEGTWNISDFTYSLSGTSLSLSYTIRRADATSRQVAYVSLTIRYKAS